MIDDRGERRVVGSDDKIQGVIIPMSRKSYMLCEISRV